MTNPEIEELKSEEAVFGLFAERLSLKKCGKNDYVGRCPFHSDSNPSFHVNRKTGKWLFQCFGTCKAAGSIYDLVQKLDNVSFHDAVETVRKALGSEFSEWNETKPAEAVFKGVAANAAQKTTSLESFKTREKALEENPAAKAYLDSRGISLETAKKLHFGYTQRVGKICPVNDLDLEDKGWMIYPHVEGDTITAVKFRSVVKKVFCKQPGMAVGENTPLFNSNTIKDDETLYVVEGQEDCATLEQAGYRCVSVQSSSTPCTSRNKDQITKAPTVILAGDSTPDGIEYMLKLWHEIGGCSFMLRWPDKDANGSFLKTCKGDIVEFRKLVDALTQHAKAELMHGVVSLPDAMAISDRINLEDHPGRLHFPWPPVDKMANLLPGSVLTIFASQTGMGKTTFVANVLTEEAKRGEVVLNYSAELSVDEYANLVAAYLLNKDRNSLQKQDYLDASAKIGTTRFYIGRDPDLVNVNGVLDLIEAGIRRLGATIACIDHIHHIIRNEEHPVEAQANAMRRIKDMGVKYGCKMIVVAQPRKPDQKTKLRAAEIYDAKGSEAIVSDSDAVMVIHRDLVKVENTANPPKEPFSSTTQIHLRKGRSQGTGNAYTELFFQGNVCKFYEMEKNSLDSIF